MRYIGTTLFICLLFIQSSTVSAQSVPGQAHFDEVTMTITPEYPKPNEAFTASITSYAHNVQGNTIKWLIGDILFQEGQGLDTVQLKAPIAGEAITITAKVGTVALTQKKISPVTIDILWEAQTYTPKWYQGRALPVDGSYIQALAIPQISKNQHKNTLIYNWYQDGRALVQKSGVIKDTINLKAPSLFDDYILSVEVTNTQGHILGQAGVKIKNIEPQIVFYGVSPITGIGFMNALGKNNAGQQAIESTITAIPYYFSVTSLQDLVYDWNISQARYVQEEAPNTITLTQYSNQTKTSLKVSHPKNLLQNTKSSLSIPRQSAQSTYQSEEAAYESPFGNSSQ